MRPVPKTAWGLSAMSLSLVLGSGLLLSVIGGFGTIVMTLHNFKLEPITVADQTLYVVKLSVGYLSGVYPA